jgi:hypothetical protein
LPCKVQYAAQDPAPPKGAGPPPRRGGGLWRPCAGRRGIRQAARARLPSGGSRWAELRGGGVACVSRGAERALLVVAGRRAGEPARRCGGVEAGRQDAAMMPPEFAGLVGWAALGRRSTRGSPRGWDKCCDMPRRRQPGDGRPRKYRNDRRECRHWRGCSSPGCLGDKG